MEDPSNVISQEEEKPSLENAPESDEAPTVPDIAELFLVLSSILDIPADQVSTVLCSVYAFVVLLLVLWVGAFSPPAAAAESSKKTSASAPLTSLGSMLFHSGASSVSTSALPSSAKVVVHHYDPAAASRAAAGDLLLSSVDDQTESDCIGAAQWPQPGESSSSESLAPSSGSVVVEETEVQAEDPLLSIMHEYLRVSGKTTIHSNSEGDCEGEGDTLQTVLRELVAENLQMRAEAEKMQNSISLEQQRYSKLTDSSMRLASQLGQVSEQLQRTQSRLAAKEEHQRWMQGNHHRACSSLSLWVEVNLTS